MVGVVIGGKVGYILFYGLSGFLHGLERVVFCRLLTFLFLLFRSAIPSGDLVTLSTVNFTAGWRMLLSACIFRLHQRMPSGIHHNFMKLFSRGLCCLFFSGHCAKGRCFPAFFPGYTFSGMVLHAFLLSVSGNRMFSSALFFRTFLWARFSVSLWWLPESLYFSEQNFTQIYLYWSSEDINSRVVRNDFTWHPSLPRFQ